MLRHAAKLVAKLAHKGQVYGELPYTFHLGETVSVLYRYTELAAEYSLLESACWLHDSVEDTDVTIQDLRSLNEDLAYVVYLVTDPIAKNRRERKRLMYENIRSTAMSPTAKYSDLANIAIEVKLCDRIANVEHCIRTNNVELLKMYKKEQPEFEANLKLVSRRLDRYWSRLENLFNYAIK